MNPNLKLLLEKERTIHIGEITCLFQMLDRKFHLRAASLPIDLTYDEEKLGSYTRASQDEAEHFTFSLLHIGYCIPSPLSKEARQDLYRHEYAHYMQYHIEIPREHLSSYGSHGSAWKYCCSLVDAIPTEFFDPLDFERKEALSPGRQTVSLATPLERSLRQMKLEGERAKGRARYSVGDLVSHPIFGSGHIEKVEPMTRSVRLHIRFGDSLKKMDQEWLIRSDYCPASDKLRRKTGHPKR